MSYMPDIAAMATAVCCSRLSLSCPFSRLHCIVLIGIHHMSASFQAVICAGSNSHSLCMSLGEMVMHCLR